MEAFKIISNFTPKGDQPKAIESLSNGILQGIKNQVLLGVTGSGKTFTVANVIEKVNKPTLVIAPNKTLAGQLFNEFKTFFPENSVEYFVSYYDYYQPEAYIPTTDTYIQKDSSINEMIDKLRHSATRSVLSKRDTIVVASVSCIFGLGDPKDYLAMRVVLTNEATIERDKLLRDFVSMQYERNDIDFHRGTFRVRGDRVEIFPAYEEDKAVRIEFFGDQIETISEIDPLKGTILKRLKYLAIFPASHYVTQKTTLQRAIESITKELKERISYFRSENQLIEAQRIEERTNFDLEMMLEMGYCNGIENYSRHLTGRANGEPPPTLIDYFPKDFLLIIDESHIAVPQVRGMFNGDRSRKETLVKYGFRLPSALDNRPLRFEEFKEKVSQVIYVSATPANYEIELSKNFVIEQIVRPTGLLDPVIVVKKASNQVDDLYDEMIERIKINEKILVTTLTKRMAEDLADYYTEMNLRVRYLHADILTMERMEIIKDLRLNNFDILIGINLLREGLDIPEVSLVAILDADKEGFLRSSRSLIQITGRAARNIHGTVIMYADTITPSMKQAIDESLRRRKIQKAFNKKHNITPATIEKEIFSLFEFEDENSKVKKDKISESVSEYEYCDNIEDVIKSLEKEMKEAALELNFERAAKLRDQIKELKSNCGRGN